MSEVVRLTLVSHAMTDAMAAGRFPTDEPLNSVGYRQVDASIELGVTERVYCGPEKRTRQTAELLGLHATVDNKLADLDCGRWRGDVVGGVQPDDLAIWLEPFAICRSPAKLSLLCAGPVRWAGDVRS